MIEIVLYVIHLTIILSNETTSSWFILLCFLKKRKVFEFADRHRGAYSSSLRYAVCPFYCDVNGYQDELLWGAAWLHKASRRRVYREYIIRNEVVLRAGDTINEFGWDNKHAGINILLSKVHFTYTVTLSPFHIT